MEFETEYWRRSPLIPFSPETPDTQARERPHIFAYGPRDPKCSGREEKLGLGTRQRERLVTKTLTVFSLFLGRG